MRRVFVAISEGVKGEIFIDLFFFVFFMSVVNGSMERFRHLAADLDRYSKDPYGWVLYAFPWGRGELAQGPLAPDGAAAGGGPDVWQREVLQEIGDELRSGTRPGTLNPESGAARSAALSAAGAVIRSATASGHGIGKSALVGWLILWALTTFEETKGVVTANTEKQLKTKTWAELAKWFRLCWFAKPMFELTSTAIYRKAGREERRARSGNRTGSDKRVGAARTKNRTGDRFLPTPRSTAGAGSAPCFLLPASVSQKTWRVDQVPWSVHNTEAFAGLHNKGKRIILIFDEASAIPDPIWEVSEGALTDEGTQIMWCVFGNPTRNTGRFKDCFTGNLSKRWRSRQIDSRSCAIANKDQIRQWAKDYGEDSDFFKVRVKGVFPSMSAKQFISVADVDAAYGRVLRPGQYDFAPKILAVDPAWEGDDELVIGLRQGLCFRILRVIAKNDNDIEIADIVARLEDEERCDAVFIDAGYGTGIVSAGRTMGRSWQLVWFSAQPVDPGCANKRAEMWKAVRDWLKSGGAIPKDSVLYNDLIGPETVARIDGKLQLEAKSHMKERGLRSPNRADCLAISFAYPVAARGGRRSQPAFALTEYDPFE